MKKSNYRFPGTQVLVAEDNEFSIEIIEHMLALMDITTEVATDGKEALALISKKSYDLVILDIHMPKISGVQVAQEIRKMKIQQPQIIAFTASVMPSEIDEVMQAGFDDYIYKPIELPQLENVFRKCLKHKLVEQST